VIEESVEKAAELIRRLLIFSRKVESELRPACLNDLIRQVSRLLERTIPRMITVELDLSKDIRLINADPIQIEQVLMNLGVNARDAMPDGGKLIFKTENMIPEYCHPEITRQEYVMLMVSDTGQGMDTDILEHIFEPFFTTKKLGKGTGLGLSVVYGIVKSHNAHIRCFSEPGQGARFEILFPVLKSDEEKQCASQKKEENITGGTETILLADDDVSVSEAAKDVLNCFGYTAVIAENGEKALDIYSAEKDRTDLLILDLNMPGMGGYKCFKEILRINPDAKIIIASGYSQGSEAKAILESSGVRFIAKPYKFTELLKAIRSVLDA
jgi:CheY-like chemotaxis protein